MRQKRICCPGGSQALQCAAAFLGELGFEITTAPDADAAHLLLPVPSFPAAEPFLADTLRGLSKEVLISGGNLGERFPGYRTVDFLKDPYYLAENAAITASCALKIAENRMGNSLEGCPVLVVGWGRIGKCLCRLLEKEGADVTAAARKDTDRAMIRALGCDGISIEDAAAELTRYRVIFNTVPAMVLPDLEARQDAVILELASTPGMSGANIISARGLPGKMAPEASGRLIARTFLRLSFHKEA